MLRNVTLEDISDGRLYSENDLVKADTDSCKGCRSVCCHGMGKTIVLDPYDIYSLTTGLNKSFEELMNGYIELNVVDGVILPNLAMSPSTNSCAFLNNNNMCDIHTMRPGICRLFPLGRYWEDDEHFKYILQKDECNKDNLSKIKVKKWLGIDNLSNYNAFVVEWHGYLKSIQAASEGLNEEQIRILNMFTLRSFYQNPYDEKIEFFGQFKDRLSMVKEKLGL